MKNYIDIKKVVECESDIAGCHYTLIEGKRIMFESTLVNGEKIVMCSPQASYQPTIKACWVDLTLIQCELMESFPNAIIVFRLDGEKLSKVNWNDLKPHLTEGSMKNYSKKEKKHWKLHIHDDSIKVVGNLDQLSNKTVDLAILYPSVIHASF